MTPSPIVEEWTMLNEEEAPGRAPTRIQSVAKAARFLALIAGSPGVEWKARSMAKELGTSLPGVYHLANTLSDAGLISVDESGRYTLGIAVGRLASAYYEQSVPPPELLVPLKNLARETGETSYLSDWRNGDMEIIAEVPGTRPHRVVDLGVGFHGMAHARASGKVLLAFGTHEQRERYIDSIPLQQTTVRTITDPDVLRQELRAVHDQGYGAEYGELLDGIGCLSVPVIDDGLLFGAYTVSAPLTRIEAENETYLKALKDAASVAGKAIRRSR